MKKLSRLCLAIGLCALLIITSWPNFSLVANAETNEQCSTFSRTAFPITDARLDYSLAGHPAVSHAFGRFLSSDTIVVQTTLPTVSNNIVTGTHTYTQHIHTGSRQVVFTSEPINGDRSIPGVLPQSDYTDLWIPTSTVIGSYVNIQNHAVLVGSADAQNFYAGENSGTTNFGSRIYDRTTGVFKGFNSPTPAPTLSSIKQCSSATPMPDSVSLENVALGEFHLNHCPTLTALFKNTSSNPQQTLIDIELRNDRGNLADQYVVENATVSSTNNGGFVPFTNTCDRVLPNGQYFYSVGIFTPQWSRLVHWNDHVAEFTIAANQPAISVVSVDRTKQNLAVGETTTITPRLIATDDSARDITIQVLLRNAEKQIAASQRFEHQTLLPNTPANFPLKTSSTLVADTYAIEVIVTDANNNTIASFTNLGSITVVSKPVNQGDVVLQSAFITSTPYYLSQRAVLHALFTSPTPPSQPVLLDLEVYNSSNQKVAQVWFDNTVVSSTVPLEKTLDLPLFLPAGTYHFDVGVFGTGWNGLTHWYSDAVKFELSSSGQWEDHIVILSFAKADRSPIHTNETTTMLAGFTSPNTENHVQLTLELLDKTGTVVAKKIQDNVAFPRAGTGNFENIYTMNTPPGLAAGTYSFRVTIDTLGGKTRIATYPNAATLNITP